MVSGDYLQELIHKGLGDADQNVPDYHFKDRERRGLLYFQRSIQCSICVLFLEGDRCNRSSTVISSLPAPRC